MYTPRRVVSLSPNISMILFALGADAVVVGRTQDCLPAIQQYLRVWRIPEHTVAQRLQHWQGLPVVGTWPLADRESIKTLQPEAILTSGSGLFGVHDAQDRKSTRLNSSHGYISYAVFCLKKKKRKTD